MKIKALSLWQPWASLIAIGAKRYETRSWATSYRGPLLICAAMKKPDYKIIMDLNIRGKLRNRYPKGISLPLGMAVAICDLADCYSTWEMSPDYLESILGDFTMGRYAWKLENVQAIEPFPVKGRQGLFEVEIPEELLGGSRRELEEQS